MTPPMPRPATAWTDMLDAIRHTLGTPEYAAADRAGDDDEMAQTLALAVCAALAERRSVYIPLPATVRSERQRERRDAALVAQFDAGSAPGLLAIRHRLSRRQVLRILARAGRRGTR